MSIIYIRFEVVPAGRQVRAPLLESVLARAGEPSVIADWRSEAFSVIATRRAALPAVAPAVAPVALHAAAGKSSAPWVCVASPVHFAAGMSSVRMALDGVLTLDASELSLLVQDFNRDFAGTGVRLVIGQAGSLLCEFAEPLDVTTCDPREVAGHDIWDFQPTGPGAAQLRRRMTEFEMWLFEHALNQARTARSMRSVTGLWLWGGGATIESLPLIHGWTAGDDPLFGSWGNCSKFTENSNAVVVLAAVPGTDAWPDAERRWLMPALAALRTGRLETLRLSAHDRTFSLTGRTSRFFWRRRRPWWESFE